MSIRHVNKNHLRELAPKLSLVGESSWVPAIDDDPLRFWTEHPIKPCLLDLTPFRDGQLNLPTASWGIPFTGRPKLIAQLAPALREIHRFSSESTIGQVRVSLRAWWRVFDQVEKLAPVEASFNLAGGVNEIGEVHRQVAFDSGLSRAAYGPFVRALNVTRGALGLRPLHWIGPDQPTPIRHIPTFEQLKPIRNALKRRWYSALDRWKRVEQLLNGSPPRSAEEAILIASYKRLKEVSQATGKAWPTIEELSLGRSESYFYTSGYRLPIMQRSCYPDAEDIRAAFHLCLITTGWNPSTFLSLNVDDSFIETHPRDSARYLLTGFKERAKTHQTTEGLLKCQRSAGFILMTLMERTLPLREQLRDQHTLLQKELDQLKREGSNGVLQDKHRRKLIDIEEGLRSPWLFLAERGITWLSGNTYQRIGHEGYLEHLIAGLNSNLPAEDHVPQVTATDFRDAFAAYAYQESGGMVLHVMRALGHRRLTSTQRYIDNTLLNDTGARVFQCFCNSLWAEIKTYGRLNPTIVAMWCRDGNVTDQQRERLDEYRSLKRSRLGIACKNPTRPPRRVAPDFEVNGTSLCSTQRCTLCVENAVILPESLPGLAMRKAELLHIQKTIPVPAFTNMSFEEELQNTELALLGFDAGKAATLVSDWEDRIAAGQHRVIHLELVGKAPIGGRS